MTEQNHLPLFCKMRPAHCQSLAVNLFRHDDHQLGLTTFLSVCRRRRSWPLGPTAAGVLLVGVIHVQPGAPQLLSLLLLLQQEPEDRAGPMEDTQRPSLCAATFGPAAIPLWPAPSAASTTSHLPRPLWPLRPPTWPTAPATSHCRHSCNRPAGCWPQETRRAATLVWEGEGSAGGREVGFFIFFFHNTLLDLSKCLQEHLTAEAYVGCLQQQHYYCWLISQGEEEERAREEAGSDPGQSRHARPTSQQRRINASSSPPAPSCLCGPAPALPPPTASAPASPTQTREAGEPASVSCSSPCQCVQPCW